MCIANKFPVRLMLPAGVLVPSLKNLDASWVRVWSPLPPQHPAQAPSRKKECWLNERRGNAGGGLGRRVGI